MTKLPPDYIDPNICGQNRKILECYYTAERSEGGTTDEVILRGLLAVLKGFSVKPISVTELPWEQEGWRNAEGKCWLCGKTAGDWRLINPLNSGVPRLDYCFSVALPWWAIPLPISVSDSEEASK